MTVMETFDFSARCQGVGYMLLELERRKEIAGIKPEEDLDIFLKALALGGQETGLVVENFLTVYGSCWFLTTLGSCWFLNSCTTLCEGQIVYQGPRDAAFDSFFSTFMGFHFPEQKNVADFLQEQMSLALFRLMGSLGQRMIIANTFGSFAMLIVMALGGYVISEDSILSWWIWGFGYLI